MKICAIIPFTGSKSLVEMTNSCFREFLACELSEKYSIHTILLNNHADNRADVLNFFPRPSWSFEELIEHKNWGFGIGVNRAIDYYIYGEGIKPDYFLIMNNDLQFPRRDWLQKLVDAAEKENQTYIFCPTTDITASKCSVASGPVNGKPPQRSREVSGYCWLVKRKIVEAVDQRFGFPLFPVQFTNYGSDDAAAAVLRKIYGDTPFMVVHNSWVKHLKARTANELGVKPGTVTLLKELKKWKRDNRLT